MKPQPHALSESLQSDIRSQQQLIASLAMMALCLTVDGPGLYHNVGRDLCFTDPGLNQMYNAPANGIACMKGIEGVPATY